MTNGQAVGRCDGIAVFCFGPLPSERARVRISLVKRAYAVAVLLEITHASAQRAQPFCPVFGTCGGCQVQHLEYPAQLAWKKNVVAEALRRIGGIPEPAVATPIGISNPRSYRNKMALVVRRGSAGVSLGFYRARSHDLVPIEGCPIVAPRLDQYIAALNAARSDTAIGPALQGARHVVARVSHAADSAVLTITTDRESTSVRRAGPALQNALAHVAGVTNSYDLSGENAILGRRHRVVAGSAYVEETIAGLRYRVSTRSFFQVNVEVLQRIFEYVTPFLKAPMRIVDLYCGAGTFALFFAAHGCRVMGIEENPEAIEEANVNAELNGARDGVEFMAARAEDALAHPRGRRALSEATLVFLDPPRKGCDAHVLAAIATAAVPMLWYLSCDPPTLARDLKSLVAKGYRLQTVQPFDMFPQTGHVEALAMLAHSNHRQG